MLQKNSSILKLVLFVALSIGILSGSGLESAEIKYKNEIAPYVDFLKTQNTSPTDYVMGLFEKYDIVILCERYHPEITQYEMIYDIVSDKRFIESVGHVFTELGCSSDNDKVHDFLYMESTDKNAIRQAALNLQRNLAWHPFWQPFNFYNFLVKLQAVNSNLAPEKKVNLYFSDLPFSWEGMTTEKYKEFRKQLPKRDRIMAQQVISKFNEILKSKSTRKKALIIMNYRHGFNDFTFPNGKKNANFGRFIFDEYPGRVANVMINSLALLPGTNDTSVVDSPVNDGKWDAAFEVLGNPALGFDFAGSPLGKDPFDYFPAIKKTHAYKDIFTGYIFYKPLKDLRHAVGIPGVFDDGWDKKILKRMEIAGTKMNREEMKEFMQLGEKTELYPLSEMKEKQEKIDQWFIKN